MNEKHTECDCDDCIERKVVLSWMEHLEGEKP